MRIKLKFELKIVPMGKEIVNYIKQKSGETHNYNKAAN